MKRWTIDEARTTRVLAPASPFDAATLTPDGRLALHARTIGRSSLALIDVATGIELKSIAAPVGRFLVATADGRGALVGGDSTTFALVDFASGRVTRTFQTDRRGTLAALAISADGKTIVSASVGEPFGLQVWDVATGKTLRTLDGHTASVCCIALGADGRLALSGAEDGSARAWDLASGRMLTRFAGHTGTVDSVALCPDGRTALSGDDAAVAVKRWELATGTEVASLPNVGGAPRIATPAGTHVAWIASWDGTLRGWDPNATREVAAVRPAGEGVFRTEFDAAGRRAITWGTDRALRLRDFAQTQLERDFGPRVAAATAALQRDPKSPDALATLGERYALRGDWPRAVTFLRSAGASASSLTLARAEWKTGDLAAARRAFAIAARRGEASADYVALCVAAIDAGAK